MIRTTHRVRAAQSPRGFTLIETLIALAISTILLLSLGSTVLLASRSVPTGNEPFIREGQIQRALATVAADIEVATDAVSATGSLTLTVADRDGDAAPDTITYAWNGGDKMLTRARNGGTPETLIGPVAFGMAVITSNTTSKTGVLLVLSIPDATPSDRAVHTRLLNLPGK